MKKLFLIIIGLCLCTALYADMNPYIIGSSNSGNSPSLPSRHLPLDYNISTYGGVTRDYQSLQDWEDATDNDLVTAKKGEVLVCYDDAESFDDYVNVGGATTNSDYFRVIMVADGNKHNGTPASGVHFIGAGYSNLGIIYSGEAYFQIHDCIFTLNSSSTGYPAAVRLAGTENYAIGCIVYNSQPIESGTGHYGISFTGGSGGFVNCIAIKNNANGFRVDSTGNTFLMYNCTSVNNEEVGVYVRRGTLNAYNILSDGNTGGDFGHHADGTLNQTTCVNSAGTIAYENEVSDDYHLAAGATSCLGTGTDMSEDGTYAFDDDVDGELRSAWDVGFDED